MKRNQVFWVFISQFVITFVVLSWFHQKQNLSVDHILKCTLPMDLLRETRPMTGSFEKDSLICIHVKSDAPIMLRIQGDAFKYALLVEDADLYHLRDTDVYSWSFLARDADRYNITVTSASNPEMALLLPIHISRSDGSGGLYDQINHLTVQGKNTVLDLPKCTDANHKGRWIHNSLAKSRHHSNDWVWQPFECAYNMDDRLEFTQMHLYVHKEAKETIQALISPSKCMDPSLADTKFCNKIQNNQNHVYIDDRLVYWYSIEGITSRTPKDFNRMAILKRLDLAQRQEFPDEAGFSRGTLLNEPDIVLVGPGPFVDSHRDKSTLDRTIREFAERIYANFPNALVIYKTGVYDPSRNVHEQRLFDLRVSKTFQSEVGAFVWDTWQMEISYPNVDLEYKNRVLFSRH